MTNQQTQCAAAQDKVNQSIRLIGLGFLLIVLAMGTLLAVGLKRLAESRDTLAAVIHEHNAKIEQIQEVRQLIRDRMVCMQQLLIEQDPFKRDELATRFYFLASQFIKARNQLEDRITTPEERQLFSELRVQTRLASPFPERVVELFSDGDILSGRQMMTEYALPAQGRVMTQTDRILDYYKKITNQLESRAKISYEKTCFVMALLGGLIASICFVTALTVMKRVKQDRQALQQAHDHLEIQVAERTAELGRQKQFIHQVIDADPNLIFVKNAEGRFLLVNQAMASLYGMTPREMAGHSPAELKLDAAEIARLLEADRQVIENRRPHISIDSTLMMAGGQRWLLTIKVPMEQPDGSANVLGISVDITERKAAEKKLGEACDRLQLMSSYLESVREEEQKRIARELHDEMGGVLAALNMSVARLETRLPGEMAQLSTEVGSMAKLVTAAIQAMRQTVAKLRPSILDDAGLVAAIECYAREFEENTRIECRLINRLSDEEPPLNRDRSAAVFRILQESLTNIAKHARADKVTIVLKEQGASLVLAVQDNGRGFDPDANDRESFGLRGIRERAFMAGGTIRIRSTAGKGTTVWVSVPMNPTAAHQVQAPEAAFA